MYFQVKLLFNVGSILLSNSVPIYSYDEHFKFNQVMDTYWITYVG